MRGNRKRKSESLLSVPSLFSFDSSIILSLCLMVQSKDRNNQSFWELSERSETGRDQREGWMKEKDGWKRRMNERGIIVRGRKLNGGKKVKSQKRKIVSRFKSQDKNWKGRRNYIDDRHSLPSSLSFYLMIVGTVPDIPAAYSDSCSG